jgi:hypothetical protein
MNNEINKSSKSTATVHSELYRDYLITIEHVPALTPDEDVFGINAPERYLPLIDGRDTVYAGTVLTVAEALIAAKKCVDGMLLHPLTGKSVTKAERAAAVAE